MQPRRRNGVMNRDERAFPQIPEQDPDNAEGQVEVGRDIGHRRGETAQAEDGEMLWIQVEWVWLGAADRRDDRDQVQVLTTGPGPTADHRVRADYGACFFVKPPVVG